MDKEKEETTTIRVKISTKELLDEVGKKGMTYDEILLKILIDASKSIEVENGNKN